MTDSVLVFILHIYIYICVYTTIVIVQIRALISASSLSNQPKAISTETNEEACKYP